jgi:hypothetical protein
MLDAELDVLAGFDLDEPVACQAVQGCGEPATWIATNACCNLKTTSCGTHKRMVQEANAANVAEFDARGVSSHCVVCGGPFREASWRLL